MPGDERNYPESIAVNMVDVCTVTVHSGVVTVRRTVEFDDQLYERIRALAEQQRRTINAQIQVLLEQALNQQGEPTT